MVQLYTDGGSRGNPGEAAYAFLIFDRSKKLFECGKKLGVTTNNVAEYTAVLEGLRKSKEYADKVEVFSDSELVIKQLTGEYKTKKPHLKELYKKIKEQEKRFKEVRYSNRSREHGMQKQADELVNRTLDS